MSATLLLTLVTTGLFHPLVFGRHNNPSHSSCLIHTPKKAYEKKKKKKSLLLRYVKSKIAGYLEAESRMVVTRGGEVGEIRR